jgi:hypothetical protein
MGQDTGMEAEGTGWKKSSQRAKLYPFQQYSLLISVHHFWGFFLFYE